MNLIGEHIDYNGYPVLPMAIEQSILLAVSTNTEGKIRAVNYDQLYPPFSCDVSEVSKISKPPAWYDYVLCGIYGVQQELDLEKLSGMNLAVWGKIPPAAGLSSSSALVSGAALATVTTQSKLINDEDSAETNPDDSAEIITAATAGISMNRLAQMCAAAEKYVGTQGGGMDQAACLLSKPGCAQLISFNPLRCQEVTLPEGATFVVANSLQNVNKAATTDFNCRVTECRLACHVLAKTSGLDWEEVPTMAFLQEKLGKSFDEMITLVKETFHPEPYTVDELCKLLFICKEVLTRTILSTNTRHLNSFLLRSRALHVFSEAQRVFAFKQICDNFCDEKDTHTHLEKGTLT